MSYYESRLSRRNPAEEVPPAEAPAEEEGWSTTSIALIAGGVVAAGGFAWWFFSSKKAGAEDAQTIQTGGGAGEGESAPATTGAVSSTGTERKKPAAFGTKNAPSKSVTTYTTKSGERGLGIKRGDAK